MALKLTKKEQSSGAKWVPFDEETKILMIGVDNDAYQVALERMRRRLQRNDSQFQEGEVGVVAGERTEHQNHCLLLGHFILKDWDGVEDADGNLVKFSHSAAAELLEGNIDFFVFVLKQAGKITADKAAELEETVGKPSPASNGKESGPAKRTKGVRSTSA